MFSLAENPGNSYHSLCAFYRRYPRLLLLLLLTVLLCMAVTVESTAAEQNSSYGRYCCVKTQ